MPRPRKYPTEDIVAALKEMKGMVYLAAHRLGCEADTIYYRAKKSKAITAAMESERGKVVDTAELKLYAAILAGEPWAVQFSLRTLAKSRGYVERQELSGPGGKSLEPLVIFKGEDPAEADAKV